MSRSLSDRDISNRDVKTDIGVIGGVSTEYIRVKFRYMGISFETRNTAMHKHHKQYAELRTANDVYLFLKIISPGSDTGR